jgi:hypothetical protein
MALWSYYAAYRCALLSVEREHAEYLVSGRDLRCNMGTFGAIWIIGNFMVSGENPGYRLAARR